jgi:hypothetical protein
MKPARPEESPRGLPLRRVLRVGADRVAHLDCGHAAAYSVLPVSGERAECYQCGGVLNFMRRPAGTR